MSNYSPLLFEIHKAQCMYKFGWPHLDHSLLSMKVVREKIKAAFDTPFESQPSPFKAWESAVKDTQRLLTDFKRQAREIRSHRRMMITREICNLENLVSPDSPPPPSLKK